MSRKWQIAAAMLSIAVMAVVFIKFGMRDDPPPKSGEAHVGAKHHSAEPHEGNKPWPLPAFVDVKVGDWIAFATSQQIGNGTPKVTHGLVKVEAIDDKQITVSRSERANSLDPAEVKRDQLPRQGLTIDRIVGNEPHAWTLYNLQTREETREVDGRSFATTKLAFSLVEPTTGHKSRAHVEMWMSTAVPLDGLVEMRQAFDGTSLHVTRKLVGFGTADAITWGKKPDGL